MACVCSVGLEMTGWGNRSDHLSNRMYRIDRIKAVRALAPEHQAQVINYLKVTGHEVGLLLNFGRPKLEYKRLHN